MIDAGNASPLASMLELRAQRGLFRHRLIMAIFVAASVSAIVAQQWSFLRRTVNPDTRYRNVLNLGASYQRYFSFFYFFGGFPVNLEGRKSSTLAETTATLAAMKDRLVADRSVYNRASIFLFYPDAWIKGRPDTAEMRTGHALWFTIALVSLLLAFCYAGMPLFGLLSALLLGSDPFQVYELYHVTSSTIFPTVISTGVAIVAICIVLSSGRFAAHRRLGFVLIAIAGAICALQYEIRLEGVGVFAGALFSLAICFPQSKITRLSFAVVFVAAVFATNALINNYFTRSFARANAVVASYGGRPTDSGDPYYSTQWWALWSGLGDFDEKYGFLADDRAGISYYYGRNAARPSEQIHREDVLNTIAHDPAWFAGIISSRIKRVLIDNTPYRLGFGAAYIDLPVPSSLVTGGLVLLLIGHLLAYGRRTLSSTIVNLLVLSLSIGLVAIGQLADYGLQFYCVAHLFVFAYVVCCAMDGVLLLAHRTNA